MIGTALMLASAGLNMYASTIGIKTAKIQAEAQKESAKASAYENYTEMLRRHSQYIEEAKYKIEENRMASYFTGMGESTAFERARTSLLGDVAGQRDIVSQNFDTLMEDLEMQTLNIEMGKQSQISQYKSNIFNTVMSTGYNIGKGYSATSKLEKQLEAANKQLESYKRNTNYLSLGTEWGY